MIDPDILLAHFESRILELAIPGTGARSVNTGGEPFSPAGKELRFELAAAPDEAAMPTERTERRYWTVTVTVSFPPGIGLARGYAAACRIASLYVPFDPRRGGFAIGKSRFYADDVALQPCRGDAGAIRIPVRFRLLAVSPFRTEE